MKLRTAGLVLALGVLGATAQATVLIDDFTSGFNGAIGSIDLYYQTGSANSLGGFRYVAHEFLSNPLNRPIWTEVNQSTPGYMFIEAGSGVNGFTVVGWGGSTNAPQNGFGGLNHSDFNGLVPTLNLSGEQGIRVDYINNDQSSTNFGLQIIDTSGNVSSTFPIGVAAGAGSAFIALPGGPANLSSVKMLALIVEAPNGNDITLTRVTAVPEPATLAVLGLGALAVARRKRKS